MINSIFNYILKREAYRKYLDLRNLNTHDKSNLFENLGKLSWVILWGVFCLWAMISLNFIGGLSLFILPISIIRIITSFIYSKKKTRPIYNDVPIRKSDRRYKTGYRINGYKQIVTGYTSLSEDEIDIQKNHFKGRMLFWILIFCISSIAFIYSYEKIQIKTFSNNQIKVPWDKAKSGDKIYVTKESLKNTISGIIIYRLARPLNKSDIGLLKISDWEKRQMIDRIDTTLSKELIAAFEYKSDNFYKSKSSYIGICISKDSVLKISEENESKWIELTPKSKNKKFKSIFYNLKDGYVFENKYFIMANQISLTDFLSNK